MSWIREGELNLIEKFSANILKVRPATYAYTAVVIEFVLSYIAITF